MKTVLLIWVIVQTLMMIGGWSITFLDRKKGKKRKLGYLLVAIGNFMMAAFFVYLWIH